MVKRVLIKKRASNKPIGLSDIHTIDPASWPYLDDLLKPGQWVRAEFHWYVIEPSQGVYNWTDYDFIVAQAAAAGLNVLAILNQPPAWVVSDVANLATHVQSIATQFRTRYAVTAIQAWEVFNEPNTPGFGWPFNDGGGAAQAARYAVAVNAFAAGYRPATGRIVIGALNLSNDPTGFTTAVLAAVPLANFDAYSVHPYGFATLMPTFSANVKALMVTQYGSSKPVWFTEMGTDVDADRLTVLSDSFAQIASIDAFFWFALRDLASSGFDYGVLEFDYTKKTAQYNALKAAFLAAA